MAKPAVDVDACEGCGTCEEMCPEVFKVEDDGKAHVKKAEVKKITCEKEAADSCPVQCIYIK